MNLADDLFESRLRELAVARAEDAIYHAVVARAPRPKVIRRQSFRTHASDGHEIALVTEGSARIVTDSESFDLVPGRLLFIDPGVEHAELPSDSCSPYVLFWCYCDSTFARLDQTSYRPPSTYHSGPVAELPGRTSIVGIAEAISSELAHRDVEWSRAVHSLLSYLTCILLRRLRRGDILRLRPPESPTVCADPRTWRVIQAALQFSDLNFRSPLRVTDVARSVGYSPSHLSYLFSTYIGHSLSDHIRRLRLSAARDLLENTDSTISEIARSVGYADPAHFTRAFTRANDLSPKAYRERLRGL
jgi:AraC-like DNA-binding protein/mannose-6-phosphate isomerase-like protein (cupin superfamily)